MLGLHIKKALHIHVFHHLRWVGEPQGGEVRRCRCGLLTTRDSDWMEF
jgi:hypothetical protein